MTIEKSKYTVSFWTKISRMILRFIIRVVYHILTQVRITGQENVPKDKAFVIAFNHISYYEPSLLMSFWRPPPEAMGAEYLFKHPVFKILALGYKAIPVNRGQYDRKVLQTCIDILNSGRTLTIAPEGTRSKTIGMNRANAGISYIVDKAKVPVLPIGFVGTTSDMLKKALRFKRPLVELRIGKPFMLPEVEGKGQQRRDSRQNNADYVMVKIAELLPLEYRGFYAGKTIEEFINHKDDKA